MERENLQHRGAGYLLERARRVWNFGHARATLALNGTQSAAETPGKMSMAYILEALGVEHDKAFEKYRPQAYAGNAVVFRAAKQLRGLMADSTLGWKEVLIGEMRICEAPGHQQNMLIEPNVKVLARELGASLAAAQQRFGLVEA